MTASVLFLIGYKLPPLYIRISQSKARSFKISQFPQLWASSDTLLSFAATSKVRQDLSNKGVLKLKLQKITFFVENIDKDSDDFRHRKITLKSDFGTS